MARLRAIGATLLFLAIPGSPASAAPPAPVSQDLAKADPLKPVFEALPEDQRRAIQDALVWAAEFNGVVSGSYGPRTRDSLLAFSRRTGIAAAAALDPATRAKLLADAEAARRAVGFAVLRDAGAGVRIGLPLRLLPTRSDLPGGTRFSAPDGAVVVDTLGTPSAGPDDLAEVFDRLTRDAPGRHVTYRLARPDFVVVSGDAGERKFYARYVLGSVPGEAPALRGFALSYPRATGGFEAVALAVAAAFEPFPPLDAPEHSAARSAAAPPIVASATASASRPVVAGQAVLVGPGLALTRMAAAARCANVAIGGTAAKWLKQDPATGLALLGLDGRKDGTPVPVSAATSDAPRYALFLVSQGDAVDAEPMLAVAATLRPAEDEEHVTAPLQGPAAGAALIDGAGALTGLVADSDARFVQIGGVVAERRYGVVDAGRISAFLREARIPVSPPDPRIVTAGAAAARWRDAVLPLRCTP